MAPGEAGWSASRTGGHKAARRAETARRFGRGGRSAAERAAGGLIDPVVTTLPADADGPAVTIVTPLEEVMRLGGAAEPKGPSGDTEAAEAPEAAETAETAEAAEAPEAPEAPEAAEAAETTDPEVVAAIAAIPQPIAYQGVYPVPAIMGPFLICPAGAPPSVVYYAPVAVAPLPPPAAITGETLEGLPGSVRAVLTDPALVALLCPWCVALENFKFGGANGKCLVTAFCGSCVSRLQLAPAYACEGADREGCGNPRHIDSLAKVGQMCKPCHQGHQSLWPSRARHR